MADLESVQNDLTALLKTTLDAISVPLVLENAPLQATQKLPTQEWAEVRVHTAGRIREIGGRTAYHFGAMILEIYTEMGKGAARRMAIANAIANAFMGVRVGAASCYEVDPRAGARDDDGHHWHSGCSVRFKWEHTPA